MDGNDSLKHEPEGQTHEDIGRLFCDFLRNREEMICLIQASADKLDDVHKSVKITKVVTGSTGIAGTVICAAGLLLAIPTAGLSLVASIGGGVLAAASGTAHLGSDIFEHLFTKSHLDKLNELCQADEANILKLDDYLKRRNEIIQKNFINKHKLRQTASSIFAELSSLSNLTCSIIRVSQAATLTVNSVKIIGATSAVLGIATLPVQIIDLAANAHALGKKQASNTSVQLRQLAKELTAQAGNIKKFIEDQQLSTNYQ